MVPFADSRGPSIRSGAPDPAFTLPRRRQRDAPVPVTHPRRARFSPSESRPLGVSPGKDGAARDAKSSRVPPLGSSCHHAAAQRAGEGKVSGATHHFLGLLR